MNYLKKYNERFHTEVSDDNLLEIIDMFEIEDLDLGLDKFDPNLWTGGTIGYYHIGFFNTTFRNLKSSPSINGLSWTDIGMVIHVIVDLNFSTDVMKRNGYDSSELDNFLKSFEDRVTSAGYILDKQIPGHYYYLSYIYLS